MFPDFSGYYKAVGFLPSTLVVPSPHNDRNPCRLPLHTVRATPTMLAEVLPPLADGALYVAITRSRSFLAMVVTP